MATDDVSTTGEGERRHVSVSTDGKVVAVGEVDTTDTPTVHATVYSEVTPLPGHTARAVIDAVVDLPDVITADRLHLTASAADPDLVHRMQDRYDDVSTRRAGASILIDAAHRAHFETEDTDTAAAQPPTTENPATTHTPANDPPR